MRFEETREIPISAKKMWDHHNDFNTWPLWYAGCTEILDPDTAAWGKVGDTVRVAYKVLGRRLEFPCTLDEYDEYKVTGFVCDMPNPIPRVHQTWRYTDLGDDRMMLDVVMEGEEPINWFGKIIDKMVLPRIYQRDVATSLDNLAEIAAVELVD